MGWNSISLIDSEGALLEPVGGEAVLDLYHAGGFERCDWAHLGTLVEEQDYFTRYLEALEKHINLEAIRSADFTVIIDPVGGSGCPFIEAFARRLNLTLVPVNAQQSGYLPRDPEPRPRSALQMASIIPYVKANAGFVLSSDMSRMSLVTEDGEPASEEYTLAVIVDHVMQKTPGTIVTNCCTSRTIDDIAVRHRIPLIKTRVGQAFVFSALADEQGLLGGEGSGSAGLPAFSNAFDGFLMMALILEAMAVSEEPLSSLLKRLPRYHILKLSRDCDAGAAYHAIERLQEGFKERGEVRMDLTDGIRFDWSDSWVHARLSRTEKTLRIIAEAPSRKKAQALAKDVIRIVEQEL
jgi:phosphomannomutase